MDRDELAATEYGRGLGLAACQVYSQSEVDGLLEAERARCADLAGLAVSHAKNADWARVDETLDRIWKPAP